MSGPTDHPRRCFTHGCTGIPLGTAWECPKCKQRIHAASEAATTRCRCGACAAPSLPPMPGCAACRRVAVEQRRAARELANSLPHTRLASEVTR